MSPEHFFDFRKADQRADIYSLGKILYEAVDGKIDEKTLPFKTASLANTDTSFFQKLDEIIRKATAEKKEERLDSVEKLRDNLQGVPRQPWEAFEHAGFRTAQNANRSLKTTK